MQKPGFITMQGHSRPGSSPPIQWFTNPSVPRLCVALRRQALLHGFKLQRDGTKQQPKCRLRL